jgi:hypothetical protein
MNTDIKITKKQKLAMILMGVTATLTQGARVQGSLPQPIERYPPLLPRITSSLDRLTQVSPRLVLLLDAQVPVLRLWLTNVAIMIAAAKTVSMKLMRPSTMDAMKARKAPARNQSPLLKAATKVNTAGRSPSRKLSRRGLSLSRKVERRARSSPDLTHAQALPDPTANRALISSKDPTRAPCHAQMPPLALAASENLNLALLHLPLLARNRDINSSVKRDSEVALLTVSRSHA